MSRDGRIRRERHGVVSLALDPVEAAIIRDAFADLMALLEGRAAPDAAAAPAEIVPGLPDPFAGDAGPTAPPADPALARLLPDAYRDDAEAAADFRRFTEQDLVAGKQANIRALLATLAGAGAGAGDGTGADGSPSGGPVRVHLDADALRAWLYALNDLRLALGSRLEIEDGYEETIAAMELDDPRLPHFALYEWLTGLQDALVRTQL